MVPAGAGKCIGRETTHVRVGKEVRESVVFKEDSREKGPLAICLKGLELQHGDEREEGGTPGSRKQDQGVTYYYFVHGISNA